jgi:hypothetical protein
MGSHLQPGTTYLSHGKREGELVGGKGSAHVSEKLNLSRSCMFVFVRLASVCRIEYQYADPVRSKFKNFIGARKSPIEHRVVKCCIAISIGKVEVSPTRGDKNICSNII